VEGETVITMITMITMITQDHDQDDHGLMT
jgi:hypothetical protein